MYIVNTSFMVEPKAHGQWYVMFTERFIPMLRAEGFEDLVFTRVLSNSGDAHYTYSLQVSVADIPSYQRFMDQIMGEYSNIVLPAFGQNVLHFTSLLKRIPLEDAKDEQLS